VQFLRRSKIPELPVVLLEDFGALIGLVLASFAVVMAIITHSGVWDGIGSLCIGSLLFVIAVFLAAEMKSLLIGEAADPAVEAEIICAIEESEPVVSLIHLRTEHLGPEDLLVVAKVEFDHDMRVRDLADAVDLVEFNIRERVPEARLLFIEPDVRRERPEGLPVEV
jgi:divalent metal cation (Fe/Co/Zn/Cd) transporter